MREVVEEAIVRTKYLGVAREGGLEKGTGSLLRMMLAMIWVIEA